MSKLSFTVLGTPAPQGSLRSVGKFMKCDNPKTIPYRQEVGWAALRARGGSEIWAGRHVPVKLTARFFFKCPARKSRALPSVRPDLDKTCRSLLDACSGVLWVDDGQVVELVACKRYGLPERTEIEVEILQEVSA